MSNASTDEPDEIFDTTQYRTLVVLCTYNEVGNIAIMVEALHKSLPNADIVVVDDNSPDGTSDWVKRQQENDSQLHLIHRPGKLGLGTALRDAIAWCLDREYDYLINLDADLSHDPATAPLLLQETVQKQLDIVAGTRYRDGGGSPGLPFHRKLISRSLNIYATRILRLPISDCSGSFRCYRVSKLRELELQELACPGYGFLEEILVALRRKGAAFGEVPIVFDCRHAGESKLSFSDAMGAIKVIHRLAFR
ncbi:MAG: polyprenol monophosphomannose synthase [Planctomycetota bacterium]